MVSNSKIIQLPRIRADVPHEATPPAAAFSTKTLLALSEKLVSEMCNLDRIIEQLREKFVDAPPGPDRDLALADLSLARHQLRYWHPLNEDADEPTADK